MGVEDVPDSSSTAAEVAARIFDGRTRRGLSEEQLARAAELSVAYLRQLLAAGPDFDPGALLRVAKALDVAPEELLSGAGAAPGTGQAGPHPALLRLTEDECWDLLGTHGIGRIALSGDGAPLVVPVNFRIHRRTVVVRTAPGSPVAGAWGRPVSFQVDRFDDRLHNGWSVLVEGSGHRVMDESERREVEEVPGSEPWAGGPRDLWLRIVPDRVTGRRIGRISEDGRIEP
ncbi:helix-turn-helix domain-containing protein [Kitasatospora sp. NPDC054939]